MNTCAFLAALGSGQLLPSITSTTVTTIGRPCEPSLETIDGTALEVVMYEREVRPVVGMPADKKTTMGSFDAHANWAMKAVDNVLTVHNCI